MLHPDVLVYTSEKEGKGLFASRFIPKDSRIWQLDEQEKRLTKEEVEKLSPDLRKLAYQFGDAYILATDSSQWMNHSCNPNTWWEDDTCLVASRDIQPGEEITYDYSTTEIGPWVSFWKCECGSLQCRGYITGNDCLNSIFQERHHGHLPTWTVHYIKTHDTKHI